MEVDVFIVFQLLGQLVYKLLALSVAKGKAERKPVILDVVFEEVFK